MFMLQTYSCKSVIEINYYAHLRNSAGTRSTGKSEQKVQAEHSSRLLRICMRMHRVPNPSKKEHKGGSLHLGLHLRHPLAPRLRDAARAASADAEELIKLFRSPSTTFLNMQPSAIKPGRGFGE